LSAICPVTSRNSAISFPHRSDHIMNTESPQRADYRTSQPAISTFKIPVRSSAEVFGVRSRGTLDRPDFRGQPAMTPNEEYAAINAGAQPRGSIDRPHRSAAEATAQAAGPGVYPEVIAALKVELEAQRELATRQAAQIQQLLERLDALDGNQPEEAA
jgi:hypothetical protein